MRRSLFAVSLVAGLALAAGCQPPGEAPKQEEELVIDTDEEKILYAIGLATGMNLSRFYLTDEEMDVVDVGLRDAVLGREPQVDIRTQQRAIQEFQRNRAAAAAEEEKQASQSFLDAEAAKEGAIKTDSGLIYIELDPGEGQSPKASDLVVVHYHGTLRDGTVFDSSIERGQPFRTRLNSVIPCWTEGVQKMKVGGKSRLVCPSDIAYRNLGAPPKIKPGAALAFDVELLEIVGGKPPQPDPPKSPEELKGGTQGKAPANE